MHLSDHSLRQIDDDYVPGLSLTQVSKLEYGVGVAQIADTR